MIDAADVPLVEGWNWFAMPAPGGLWYACRSNNRSIRLHQTLMPTARGYMIDHIDNNGLNCRRSNLRVATPLQNARNQRPRGEGSRFKGVGPHGTRWRARITVEGRRFHLGAFASEEEAARVYDVAAQRYFGEFAVFNFPREITG